MVRVRLENIGIPLNVVYPGVNLLTAGTDLDIEQEVDTGVKRTTDLISRSIKMKGFTK